MELATQWVAYLPALDQFGVREIELAKILQSRQRIAASEFALQAFGQELQRSLAVPGSAPAALLVLDNFPTNEPIANDLRGIDRASGCDASRTKNVPNAAEERSASICGSVLAIPCIEQDYGGAPVRATNKSSAFDPKHRSRREAWPTLHASVLNLSKSRGLKPGLLSCSHHPGY